MPDDLVSRVMSAITLLEQGARQGGSESWHTMVDGYDQVEHDFECDCHVPAEVLRLCRSLRDIAEIYERLADIPPNESTDRFAQRVTLQKVVELLACGLGIEEVSDERSR